MRFLIVWICHSVGHICSKLMFQSKLLAHIFFEPYQFFMKWSWKLQGKRRGKYWPWYNSKTDSNDEASK